MDNELKWLLTLVPWTLQRLLRKEFEVTCDTNGMPEALEMDQRYGPSTEKMEEDLKAIAHTWPGLEDLSAVTGPSHAGAHLGSLGKDTAASSVFATRGTAARGLARHRRFCVLGTLPF